MPYAQNLPIDTSSEAFADDVARLVVHVPTVDRRPP